MDIEQEVHKVIKRWKTRNPFEIAEQENIHILTMDMPPSIRGMALKARGHRYIVLNEEMEGYERRAVCAHELGHHFLHPGTSYRFIEEKSLFIPGRFEREANEFAAMLLVDESLIYSGDTIGMIAEKLEVPSNLVAYYRPMFNGQLMRSGEETYASVRIR